MPQRWIEYQPVNEIIGADRNPKGHDLDKIVESMGRFGYTESIIIDERTGKLVSGHGRVESLTIQRDKGLPVPDGIEVDGEGRWLVPVSRGWSSKDDIQAEAYILAANRLVELGGWVEDDLADVLRDLDEAGALDATGFTQTDLETILKGLDDGRLSGDTDVDDVDSTVWGVIVECDSEAEQVAMLGRLAEQGYRVRALMGTSH